MRNLLAVLAVMVVASVFVSVTVPEDVRADDRNAVGTPDGVECIQKDATGAQRWFGEPEAEAKAVANQLQALIDAHPDQATGVVHCSDYQGVVISVAQRPQPEFLNAIDQVQRAHPAEAVTVAQVPASLKELVNLSKQASLELDVGDQIVSIGPDIAAGGLAVGITNEAESSLNDIREQVREFVVAVHGEPLPLSFTVEGTGQLSTRTYDSPPYWMGARLSWSVGGESTYCTAGFPIQAAGAQRLLTAGHCTGAAFINNGSVVGTNFTTAYPGNALIYGDWKLIDGKPYGLRLFNGPLSSNAAFRSLVRFGAGARTVRRFVSPAAEPPSHVAIT